MIVSGIISTYKIRFSQTQNYTHNRSSIYCFSQDRKIQILIVFYLEHESISIARIDELGSLGKRIVVYFPMSMFDSIHKTLQTEKPFSVYANNNNDYTQVVFGTKDEQVGEEEDEGVFWFT